MGHGWDDNEAVSPAEFMKKHGYKSMAQMDEVPYEKSVHMNFTVTESTWGGQEFGAHIFKGRWCTGPSSVQMRILSFTQVSLEDIRQAEEEEARVAHEEYLARLKTFKLNMMGRGQLIDLMTEDEKLVLFDQLMEVKGLQVADVYGRLDLVKLVTQEDGVHVQSLHNTTPHYCVAEKNSYGVWVRK